MIENEVPLTGRFRNESPERQPRVQAIPATNFNGSYAQQLREPSFGNLNHLEDEERVDTANCPLGYDEIQNYKKKAFGVNGRSLSPGRSGGILMKQNEVFVQILNKIPDKSAGKYQGLSTKEKQLIVQEMERAVPDR